MSNQWAVHSDTIRTISDYSELIKTNNPAFNYIVNTIISRLAKEIAGELKASIFGGAINQTSETKSSERPTHTEEELDKIKEQSKKYQDALLEEMYGDNIHY